VNQIDLLSLISKQNKVLHSMLSGQLALGESSISLLDAMKKYITDEKKIDELNENFIEMIKSFRKTGSDLDVINKEMDRVLDNVKS
jgi:hypothetical protein